MWISRKAASLGAVLLTALLLTLFTDYAAVAEGKELGGCALLPPHMPLAPATLRLCCMAGTFPAKPFS
jgi:hypothetical protein